MARPREGDAINQHERYLALEKYRAGARTSHGELATTVSRTVISPGTETTRSARVRLVTVRGSAPEQRAALQVEREQETPAATEPGADGADSRHRGGEIVTNGMPGARKWK